MEDKNIIDKIKEKFSRIFKKGESIPRNPKILKIIYDEIESSEEPIKISNISKNTKIKESTIRRYIKNYLQEKAYVEKSRVYTPPFLMVISYENSRNKNTKPEFIYGKENKRERIELEKKLLKEKMILVEESEKDKLKTILKSKEYTSIFIKAWNEIIDSLWTKQEFSVNKLKIASGANRYRIKNDRFQK